MPLKIVIVSVVSVNTHVCVLHMYPYTQHYVLILHIDYLPSLLLSMQVLHRQLSISISMEKMVGTL